MNAAWRRRWVWLGGALLVLPLGGCALVSDMIAPSLPLQLGLDPATVTPQQGVVVVAFNNTTQFPAEFYAYEAPNAQNVSSSSRNFSAQVDAGKQQNEVLDCPVGVISPGSLNASFQPDSTAVTVAGTAGTQGVVATVAYTGPALEVSKAYSCGDLIEIRLSATGTTDQPTFAVSVRVIPGR